jgi:Protein kinase domain
MGEVYLATDRDLGRRVALKILGPQQASSSLSRAFFLREARAQARVRHLNVAMVFDVGSEGELDFLSVEYIEGQDLSSWLEIGPSTEEILAAYLQAGRGLSAVHAAGLVHRDVKPANLLREASGRVVLADFGLARWGDLPGHEDPQTARSVLGELGPTTLAGDIVGTPRYMSPEQRAGLKVDARSDQYSFCVALARSLGLALGDGIGAAAADQVAALGSHAAAVAPQAVPTAGLEAHRPLDAKPGAASSVPASRVPPRITAALRRGLSAKPADRFPSMAALLAELEPRARAPRTRLLAGVAAVLLLGGAVAAWWRWPSPPIPLQAGFDLCAAPGISWPRQRAQQVERAFADSKNPEAQRIFRTLDAAVNARVGEWQKERASCCTDRKLEARARAQRLTCLEQSRQELEAFLTLAEHADAELVSAGGGLPGEAPGRCRSISTATWSPQPEDSALAAKVRAQRQRLAQVPAQLFALRISPAKALASQVVAEARTLQFPPLLAEALVARCKAAVAGEDLAAARAACEESALLADAAGHERIRAGALTELARAEVEMSSDEPRKLELLRRARAAVNRGGDRRMAAKLSLLELTLVPAPRDPDTEAKLRRVAEELAALGDQDSWLDAMAELSERLLRGGDFAASLAAEREILTALQNSRGELTPHTAISHVRVADVLRMLGRYEEARQEQARMDAFRKTEYAQAVLRDWFADMRPEVTRSVRVRVRDPQGANASVVIGEQLLADGAYLDGDSNEANRQAQRFAVGVTDAAGEVTLIASAERRMWGAAESGELRSTAFWIDPGPRPASAVERTVRLRRTGRVAGVIHEPIVGGQRVVELSDPRGSPMEMRLRVPVQSDGSFEVSKVAPGRWRLAVVQEWWRPSRVQEIFGQWIEVKAGRTTRVEPSPAHRGRVVAVTVLAGPGVTLTTASLLAVPAAVIPRSVQELMDAAGEHLQRGRVAVVMAKAGEPLTLTLDRDVQYSLCAVPFSVDLADPRATRDAVMRQRDLPVQCMRLSRRRDRATFIVKP